MVAAAAVASVPRRQFDGRACRRLFTESPQPKMINDRHSPSTTTVSKDGDEKSLMK